MDKRVDAVCQVSYYHLRALQHIRRSLTDDMAAAVGCAVVGVRLDYANAVLLASRCITRKTEVHSKSVGLHYDSN
jgi:hypothetical protein